MRYRRELNKINFKGGFWPTRHQELLLQACLLQGKEALDAWCKWKSTTDVDRLDIGSLRLMPLLYRNLQAHGVEDNLMNKFKGVYRFTLYKNHMLLHNMANVLAGFYDTGIQAMVLKGVALTLLHYRDYGLRPMEDLDVLIGLANQIAVAIDNANLYRSMKREALEKNLLFEIGKKLSSSLSLNEVLKTSSAGRSRFVSASCGTSRRWNSCERGKESHYCCSCC